MSKPKSAKAAKETPAATGSQTQLLPRPSTASTMASTSDLSSSMADMASVSLSTEAELSAWRKYQTNRVGYADMLDLASSGVPQKSDSSVGAAADAADSGVSGAADSTATVKSSSIVENLHKRWKAQLPYTSIGHQMLVVVNPHDAAAKRIEFAKDGQATGSKSKQDSTDSEHHQLTAGDDGTFVLLPRADRNLLISDPRGNGAVHEHSQSHVFAFATRIYWHMLQERQNQVILLSGESGSGKTEMGKLVVRQLAHLSNVYSERIGRVLHTNKRVLPSSDPSDSRIPYRLMSTIKLLESFTHASTIFNSNSSRIHKYTELQFSRSGKLVGAKIVDLMLERRRESKGFKFARGERNFHLFYDMFVPGLFSRNELERYGLLEVPRAYKYLQYDAPLTVKRGKNRDHEPTRTPCHLKNTLRGCGFGVRKQEEIFKLISAIMLLGNLEFVENEMKRDEASYVKNSDCLEKCAHLLGLYPDVLETTLTQRTSTVGVTLCADFLRPAEAARARDDFVVALYRLLFDYIVEAVNSRLDVDRNDAVGAKGPSWDYWISLLDLSGLENHAIYSGEHDGVGNRFYQLITNYADEMLCEWSVKQSIYLQHKIPTTTDGASAVVQSASGVARSEALAVLNQSLAIFVNRVSGLIPIMDSETIRILGRKQAAAGDGIQLAELYARAHQNTSRRQAIFGRSFSEALESVAPVHFLPGHAQSSFCVKHYCGTRNSAGQPPAGLKVYYDSTDFITDNKLGGRGEGSQALSADYARLIMGTADFPASSNSFLISIVSRLVDIKTHPMAGRTIVSAVRRQDDPEPALPSAGIAAGSSGLKRMPSVRRNNDDRRLAHILSENTAAAENTSARSPLVKQAVQNARNLNSSSGDDGGLAIRTGNINTPTRPSPLSARLESPRVDSPINEVEPQSQQQLPPMSPSAAARITVPTAASAFCNDLNSILMALAEPGLHRHWHIFCIKPNDDRSPGKFVDERVKEQIKRLNLALYIADKCGQFTRAMTWKEFYQSYGALQAPEAADKKLKGTAVEKMSRHLKRASLISLNVNGEALKQKCLSIYEMYGLVTRAGNGKAQVADGKIFMDERSWWALERNLAAAVLQQKIARNKSLPAPSGADVDNSDTRSIATVDSNVSNEDLDKLFLKEVDEKLNEMKKREREKHSENISIDRRRWMTITNVLTCWIPIYCIRNWGGIKEPEVIQAWREKVALNVIIFFLSSLMLFIITGFGTLLCPAQFVFSAKDLAESHAKVDGGSNYVAVHGDIYDMSGFVGPHNSLAAGSNNSEKATSSFYNFAGKDASVLFPRRKAKWGEFGSKCLFDGMKTVSSNPYSACAETHCHFYSDFVKDVVYKSIPVYKIGSLAIPMDDVSIHSSRDPEQTYWLMINERIYDVTEGIRDKLFPSVYDNAIRLSAGSAATGSNLAILQSSEIKQCLDEQFFIGVVDERNSEQCVAASYSLLVLTILLCTVMVSKFLGALQFGGTRRPEEIDRYVILQVPCYTEGEDSLKKTINSLALLDYDDEKKLLFVIADGLIKGSGNDRMTPEIVLDLLGVENSHEKLTSDDEVSRFDYVALGDGMNRLNRAKVFSGHYVIHSRRIPYIVVVKCGKESETRRPGNRGKRDSQMIMMKFLNKAFFERPMVPLEVEIYRHVRDIIGVDPMQYEYCLMVDADTEVLPDSLSRLVAVMLHDSLIMGVCGETEIGNPMGSWVTMIQVYEYYMSHHLAKAFESLFGSVTCLPGCFSMYRIRTNGAKQIPLLMDDQIIREYEENLVDTLHKKNLLSLGEDRYLTTLMLKFFPEFRTKFTLDASCRTIVPDKFPVLLSQRRRWINSTVHNLFELLRVGQLCGCLCFSMRLIIFLDLFATLVMPASLGYLGYLIYTAVKAKSAIVIAESLYLFAAVYGLQAVIFLLRMKWDMLGWMAIYLLSLPVYGLVLPMYAFWHFDDFTWGNTRSVHGELQVAHGGGADTDVFDIKSVVQTPAKYYTGKAKKENATSITKDIQKTQPTTEQDITAADSSEVNVANSVPAPELENRPAGVRGGASVVSAYAWPQPAPSHVSSALAPYPMMAMPPSSVYMSQGNYVRNQYGYPNNMAYPTPPYATVYGAGGYDSMVPAAQRPWSRDVAPEESASMVAPNAHPMIPGNIVVTTTAVQLKDGLPTTLYPLPPTIPLCLARVVIAEIKMILQTMDLNTLTKRTVRERVEANIIGALDEMEGAADSGSDVSNISEQLRESQAIINDLRQFSATGIDVDFETVPDAKAWVNLCISEVLRQMSTRC